MTTYRMPEYQRLINELRMLRAGLKEADIVRGVQQYAREHVVGTHACLKYNIRLAIEGKPLTWEE